MQIDVPEDQVMLFDSQCWTDIHNNWYICDSEEELDRFEQLEKKNSAEERERMIRDSWELAFDIEYVPDDEWRSKGFEVEAAFWELRKEQIQSVKRFTSRPSKLYRVYAEE